MKAIIAGLVAMQFENRLQDSFIKQCVVLKCKLAIE
ncbi:hypothetical protein MIDIC_500016 [Alphaproteobacteria bacterium]